VKPAGGADRATGSDDDLRTIFQSGIGSDGQSARLCLYLTRTRCSTATWSISPAPAWSRDRASAFAATDEPAARRFEASLEEAIADGEVVEPYLIEAAQDHVRERVASAGRPSATGAEARNVPL